ncbi:MAG: hypothetical protein GEU88_06595 [Solirubrobacterales bacterium]|nr:hypothetical protein [Solirubrobacterales bacterium]
MRGLRRRAAALTIAAVTALCATSQALAAESRSVDAGALRATLDSRTGALALRGADGPVLRELRESTPAAGPSGRLGFRVGGAWQHATTVLARSWRRDRLRARLATTDPSRELEVAIRRGRRGVILLEARVVGPQAGVEAIGIGFAARRGERYVGFGERSNAVDQSGRVVESYVGEGPFQAGEYPLVTGSFIPPWGIRDREDATYFPIPWLLSTAGYGVLVDVWLPAYFRLRSERPDAWSLEVAGAPEGVDAAGIAPPSTHLALRFFAGPTPADALHRLTRAIGRQPAPPASAFGPWHQPTGGDELELLSALRQADAPLSVAQTYLHYLPCGDQRGRGAEQRARTAAIHALGLDVTTYFNPMICTDYAPVYGEAAATGALTTDRAGSPYVYRYLRYTVSQLDFSAEAAGEIFGRLLGEAIDDGYDGWMEDFGEYTPLDGRSASGEPGAAMHNRYPVLYHCAARAAERARGERLLRFVRSGYTGAARCAEIVWGGDPTTGWGFDGLRSALANGLSAGLSGVGVWGSDIGGFFALFESSLSPELLTRWVQLGAVSGVMRTQAEGIAVPDKDRPQVSDPDQLANWRRYAKLRTQLFPYISAAAREYRRSGMPLMRHLALVYPRDRIAISREDEFMFGPDLLAAPVLEPGASTRKVYLPPGRWVDLWRSVDYREADGSLRVERAATLPGRREVTLPAPLDQLPLLARAGTLLALLPADVDTLSAHEPATADVVTRDDRAGRMELIAFPRGASEAAFEAHGRLRSHELDHGWELRIADRRPRAWRVQAALGALRRPFRPCAVLLDGERLGRGAWDYPDAGRVLELRFDAGRAATVTALRRCR